MGLRFEHPELLSWLAVLPLLVALAWYGGWRRRVLLLRFADPALAVRLTANINPARRWLKSGLLIAACALGIIALARPQYGFTERKLPRKALDVMIAIDTSSSMLSQDVKPNRFERARDQLKALIRQLNGDRVGIIAFAGEAYLQCPLTSDYGIAEQVLDTLTPGAVPIPGTAIGRAIELAQENFEKNEQGRRVLVLLTDGEDQGSDPIKLAKEAAKQKIVINAIGIGSETGAPIPVDGGVKKDNEGHAVNTRLNFNTLKAIAAETGGVAIKSRAAGYMELDRLIEEIAKLQKRTLTETERMIHQERYQWFLFPALILVLAEMLIGERRRKPLVPQGAEEA